MTPGPRDLVVLIADKKRDPGCLLRGHHFLKPFAHRYAHALVVFDREGSGRDEAERTLLESEVESRLSSSGWEKRAAAVVIDPELEIWVWNDSPHVESALGWSGGMSLREWLIQKGWLSEGATKPTQPKTAVEEALRLARQPRSSSIYRELARKVSTARCIDPAFLKLKRTLAGWFSQADGG